MATSNPAFSNDMFAGYEQVYGAQRSTTMTVQGTAVKTFILLAIMAATATWSWNAFASGDIAFGVVADLGNRRIHHGADHDLQAHRRPLDGPHLRRI